MLPELLLLEARIAGRNLPVEGRTAYSPRDRQTTVPETLIQKTKGYGNLPRIPVPFHAGRSYRNAASTFVCEAVMFWERNSVSALLSGSV